jgi:exodeoxyribonuclease VII large subunit
MWRSNVLKLKFKIEKGIHVIIEGSVGVYTPRGEYQFYAVHVEPYGQGALALAYEQLKKKLKSKGYFEADRKKPLPKFIQKIALVTAKESAALHDMLKIIKERWALVEVIVVDTLVQGEIASRQISSSLSYADSLAVDVVVLARGGGSVEDLWSFNEENVADVIFSMNTPVVSAIGHEVDTMISDFVADLRAPTPSAAMEMILPDSKEMLYALTQRLEQFSYLLAEKMKRYSRELKHSEEVLLRYSPSRLLIELENEFQRLTKEFKRYISYNVEHFTSILPSERERHLQSITTSLQQKEQYLIFIEQKFRMSNPRSKYRKGWAEISLAGKISTLEEIEMDSTFILNDGKIQIEALCLNKKEI